MNMDIMISESDGRATGRVFFKGTAAVEAEAREAALRGLAASGIEATWDEEGEYIRGAVNVPFSQIVAILEFTRSNLREGLAIEWLIHSARSEAIVSIIIPDEDVGNLDGRWLP
jgi:hypothetical protein